jgi:hypothetical protein
MPRYHFNVRDGTAIPDDEGTVLADLKAARHAAIQLAGALLRDNPEGFWTGEDWQMDVTNDVGLILFSLHFMATDAPSVSGSR